MLIIRKNQIMYLKEQVFLWF